MTNEIPMKYSDRALLDPAKYLELRNNDPGSIKDTKLVPPRIGQDKHLGKILVIFSNGHYEAMR